MEPALTTTTNTRATSLPPNNNRQKLKEGKWGEVASPNQNKTRILRDRLKRANPTMARVDGITSTGTTGHILARDTDRMLSVITDLKPEVFCYLQRPSFFAIFGFSRYTFQFKVRRSWRISTKRCYFRIIKHFKFIDSVSFS